MPPAIRVEHLSKRYQLGLTHAGSIRELLSRATDRLLGRSQQPLPHEPAKLNGRGPLGAGEGYFWALNDLSFEVQPGEVIGVIGSNGAGKSTLLKILSRITSPTAGRAEINGRVASLLEVGTGFHPELTGRENVFLNGAILGMTKTEIRSKFDEIVGFAEMEKFIDTPVKRYSSGMYVRLAFAVAAHLEPEILIIDEVLAVGDSQFQQRCLGKMDQVARNGRTVIFVSHNMNAVETLCPSALVLRNGRLAFSGNSDDAIRNYCGELTEAQPAPTVEFPNAPLCGARMVSASLRCNGNATTLLRAGDPLDILISFCSDTPISRPRIGLTISNAAGAVVLAWNNHAEIRTDLDTSVTSGTLHCRFGSIPFVPKRYLVSLYFGSAGADSHVATDALMFDVLPAAGSGDAFVHSQAHFNLWWPVDCRLESPTERLRDCSEPRLEAPQ